MIRINPDLHGLIRVIINYDGTTIHRTHVAASLRLLFVYAVNCPEKLFEAEHIIDMLKVCSNTSPCNSLEYQH